MASMYSAKVMEHFANPHNVGEIPDANGVGEVGNPKCGDIMRMYLKIENNVIVDVKFLTFGCGAAIAAAKAGAQVTLLERTDMLLGTGLVGGIMRNNGRFTATEEAIAMGANELFDATDATARHKNLDFPGHKHSSLYDVAKIGRAHV